MQCSDEMMFAEMQNNTKGCKDSSENPENACIFVYEEIND